MKTTRISVIGLGYIGLPTAAILASRGFHVTGVDVNQQAVDTINSGRIHIVEPDLDMVVHAAVTEGRLRATTKPESADVFILAVPTPFKDGHQPDLSFIESAARGIAPVIAKGNLVILESTSPVGTTEQLASWLAALRPDLTFPQDTGERSDVRIAHCPERVLPGQVLRELVYNDRVVGGLTHECASAAVRLYKTFVEGDCIVTNARTAEMCKLAENAFRDVNIAFANEISMICDQLRINTSELISMANRHPRVSILQPGCGVGGHCIAVDPWFIISKSPDLAKLIRTAREVNDHKPAWVISQVQKTLSEHNLRTCDTKPPTIACLGLSFKPNTDDVRCSPAVTITQTLANLYPSQVVAVDPHIRSLPDALVQSGVALMSLESACAIATVILVLVDHREFHAPLSQTQGSHTVIDTRGLSLSSEA